MYIKFNTKVIFKAIHLSLLRLPFFLWVVAPFARSWKPTAIATKRMPKLGSTFKRTPNTHRTRSVGSHLDLKVKHQLCIDFKKAENKADLHAIIDSQPETYGDRSKPDEAAKAKASYDKLCRIAEIYQADLGEFW